MYTTIALFTLGFPATPGVYPLVIGRVHILAGSFFNRHAVTPHLTVLIPLSVTHLFRWVLFSCTA